MKRKTFYVTTPIYYPSGNLHIGHVYTTTLAYVLRNYKREKGYDAIMLTGSDEHGQKIEKKADENNLNPQVYVDKMVLKFKNLWELLDIDYDLFSRTTSSFHKESVAKQFSKLFYSNLIYKSNYKGLYSVQDEEFLTTTQAKQEKGEFYHPTSGHKLEKVEEESYFFKMSNYQKWISEYYKNNPKFIIPQKIVNELVNNFIDKGLEDLSISRTSFKWGIKIKEDPKHIVYVWLDALNNYITSLGYNQKDDTNFKKYWKEGNEIVHIVGKEITRFHCIYWPIILKANEIKLPTTILSHGWIITQEGKMSKSKGNVINPIDLIKKYGKEEIKYYLASQIKVGQDGIFDYKLLINTINSDLANNVGNLVSRIIAMSIQNFKIPIKYTKTNFIADEKIIENIKITFQNYQKFFDEFKISFALKEVINLSKKLNGYIDVTMPWTLKEDKIRLEQVLNNLLNGIYAVASMLKVVMPKKMDLVLKQLNLEELNFNLVLNFNKFDEVKVIKNGIIFKRI